MDPLLSVLPLIYERNTKRVLSACKVAPVGHKGYSKAEWPMFYAIWDTGANLSAISPRVVQKCGLESEKKISVRYTRGIDENTDAYRVALKLSHSIVFPNIVVGERNPDGIDVLIGLDIIGQGDFLFLSHKDNPTALFRYPSVNDGGLGLTLNDAS